MNYLLIVNEVLGTFNEAPLTEATFDSATGFQQTIKKAVNKSIKRIYDDNAEWPFAHQPTMQVLSPGVVGYALPTTYKTIDWDSFYIQRDDSINAKSAWLSPITYDEYRQRRRDDDLNKDPDGYSTPRAVVRDLAGNFIVSGPPDKPYTVLFEGWRAAPTLTTALDEPDIYDQYHYVICDGARVEGFSFRQNVEQRDRYEKDFQAGLKNMRKLLTNQYQDIRDTRVSPRLGRNVW